MNSDPPPKGPWSEDDFRLILARTSIDYDRSKEEGNRKKHGYSLESAVYFLEGMLFPFGRPLVATSDPVQRNGEIRYQHLAFDTENNVVVLFVTTVRPEEIVRVISFRRADREEKDIYLAAVAHGHILVTKK
jgi:uncharacterized DUF497 family protein